MTWRYMIWNILYRIKGNRKSSPNLKQCQGILGTHKSKHMNGYHAS